MLYIFCLIKIQKKIYVLKQNENNCLSVNVSGEVPDEFRKFQLSVCVNYVSLTPV